MATFGPYISTSRQDKAVDILVSAWNLNHPDDTPITADDYMASRFNELLNGYAKDIPADKEFVDEVHKKLLEAIDSEEEAKLVAIGAELGVERKK